MKIYSTKIVLDYWQDIFLNLNLTCLFFNFFVGYNRIAGMLCWKRLFRLVVKLITSSILINIEQEITLTTLQTVNKNLNITIKCSIVRPNIFFVLEFLIFNIFNQEFCFKLYRSRTRASNWQRQICIEKVKIKKTKNKKLFGTSKWFFSLT